MPPKSNLPQSSTNYTENYTENQYQLRRPTTQTNYADTPYQLHQNGTGSDSAMTASCGTSLDLLTVFREKVSLRRHAVEFKFNV